MSDSARPDYGLDAPGVVITFVTLAALSAVIAAASLITGSAAGAIGPGVVAVMFTATVLAMVRSSRVGKLRLWHELLDELELSGDEEVLDVGCGRGLVAVEAARRLPSGHAVGIDLWRSRDLSGNTRDAAEANARACGVADRVEVVDGDMRELPFDDGRFDVVVSSIAVHNLPESGPRRRAVQEMARVTRPGGRIVIVDSSRTAEMVKALQASGCTDVTRSSTRFATYPPCRIVRATAGSARR